MNATTRANLYRLCNLATQRNLPGAAELNTLLGHLDDYHAFNDEPFLILRPSSETVGKLCQINVTPDTALEVGVNEIEKRFAEPQEVGR